MSIPIIIPIARVFYFLNELAELIYFALLLILSRFDCSPGGNANYRTGIARTNQVDFAPSRQHQELFILHVGWWSHMYVSARHVPQAVAHEMPQIQGNEALIY